MATGEVTDPRAKAALAGGAATAGGAVVVAGKLSSKNKRTRARREAIRKETAAQRQAKLRQMGARQRAYTDASKANEAKMKDIRAGKAKADRSLLQAAKQAEKRMAELRKIRDADMDKRQKMIKKAHVSNQRNIIKGKAPRTLLQLAKSVGLRSIPAVGAFISTFSSTPAGKGSDRGLPNPKD